MLVNDWGWANVGYHSASIATEKVDRCMVAVALIMLACFDKSKKFLVAHDEHLHVA